MTNFRAKLREDWALMTPYERRKLQLDFLRFAAMVFASFVGYAIHKGWI